MSADVKLLPLPEPWVRGEFGRSDLFTADQMQAYAHANVEAATEALRVEVERLQEYVREADRRVGEQFMAAQDANAHRLRTQMDRLRDIKRADAAEARAERLAEALRMLLAEVDELEAYARIDDEVGYRPCCGVLSYKPHADNCAVTLARAALEQESSDG